MIDTHVYVAQGNADPRCQTCGLTPQQAAIADLTDLIGQVDQVRLEIWSFDGYSGAHHYAEQAMQNLRGALRELTDEKESDK